MPVEVVGRPSSGEGRTPGVRGWGWGWGGWGGEGEWEEGLGGATLRLRKDIAGWIGVCVEGERGE